MALINAHEPPFRPGRATDIFSSCLAAVKTVIRLRPPVKYALLIGIGYQAWHDEKWKLVDPQCDLEMMRKLLKEKRGYKEENIIILSDKAGTEADKLPTKDNIKRELERFIRRGVKATYFFMYSGHSGNRKDPAKPSLESDKREEYIIPCDGLDSSSRGGVNHNMVITDKYLHEKLVKSLEKSKGSHLLALFDSCQSGTLLNLKHRRCYEVGTMRRLLCRAVVEPLYHLVLKNRTFSTSIDKLKKLRREGMECLGVCPRKTPKRKAQVVCISSCEDSEVTLDAGRGGVIVQKFVEYMDGLKNPRLTYAEFMKVLREDSRIAAEEAFRKSKVPSSFYERCKCKRLLKATPQLSTHTLLDQDSKIRYPERTIYLMLPYPSREGTLLPFGNSASERRRYHTDSLAQLLTVAASYQAANSVLVRYRHYMFIWQVPASTQVRPVSTPRYPPNFHFSSSSTFYIIQRTSQTNTAYPGASSSSDFNLTLPGPWTTTFYSHLLNKRLTALALYFSIKTFPKRSPPLPPVRVQCARPASIPICYNPYPLNFIFFL